MKTLGFSSPILLILLTLVTPVWAQEAEPELILNPRLNALVGVSDVGPEGGTTRAGVSGGATIELGAGWSTLETGALILRTGLGREGSFALPMYAKFRVLELQSSSWFVKAGGMPTFESNGFDVLMGAGVGGRVRLSQTVDLVVDATWNHGVVDQSSAPGTNQAAGLLILTGLSFRI